MFFDRNLILSSKDESSVREWIWLLFRNKTVDVYQTTLTVCVNVNLPNTTPRSNYTKIDTTLSIRGSIKL